MIVLAHGIGEVRGLPLSGELVLQTGGVVVLASFLAVALLWREPRFARVPAGAVSASRYESARERHVPSHRPGALGAVLQTLMLVLSAAIVAYGFLGPQEDEANPAPRVLY